MWFIDYKRLHKCIGKSSSSAAARSDSKGLLNIVLNISVHSEADDEWRFR